jgi:hypothetical protein
MGQDMEGSLGALWEDDPPVPPLEDAFLLEYPPG